MFNPISKRIKSEPTDVPEISIQRNSNYDNPPVYETILRNSQFIKSIKLGCFTVDKQVIDAIGQCKQLESLSVCNCMIQQQTLGPALQNCVNLNYLSLYTGEPCSFRYGIERQAVKVDTFLNSMVSNTSLSNINFACTQMSMVALANFLRNCPVLSCAVLTSCVNEDAGSKLFDGCFYESLKFLTLSYNNIDYPEVASLARNIVHCVNLVALDLSNNSIDNDGFAELVELLPASLIILKLQKNLIHDEGIAATAFLPVNLQRLNLSDNVIMGHNFAPFPKNLTILQIRNNLIDTTGLEKLTQALINCTNLQQLDIANNDIADGIAALVDVLPHCEQLQRLDLSQNPINDDDAIELARVLPMCKNFTDLLLTHTQISDIGAAEFITVLPKCGKLKILALEESHVDIGTINAIDSLLLKQPQHYAMVANNYWKRSGHTDFGFEINKVFAALLLGITRLFNNPEARVDPEMIEETLNQLNFYGLTASELDRILRAGRIALGM